ncbi:acyl-CoA thioesterase [Novosphingobium colocasiae]|uniref:Thioesterase n=1 Tax=Novosphingobium colocasiae TaxID=1256513 RepID=A0A918P8K9_9SPHN|nr:thioesterase family protein [Novosphingobium colocasiae]GGY90507.1 thioesterase [Novosphingobium colocasiae]
MTAAINDWPDRGSTPVPAPLGRRVEDYPTTITEKIRLSDTDRQGHVNNVNFAFFLEAGRSDLLHERFELRDEGCQYMIATATIDFLGELHWPGEVVIGTGIERVGKSSLSFRQGLFQHGRCVASSTSTVVQVNIASMRAQPFSEGTRALMRQAMIDAGDA